MSTEPETTAQKLARLKALEDSIARGVDYAAYDGQQVKYRPLKDLQDIRDGLRRELGLPISRRKHRSFRLVTR